MYATTSPVLAIGFQLLAPGETATRAKSSVKNATDGVYEEKHTW